MAEDLPASADLWDLKRYGVSAERGFLPETDPDRSLPEPFDHWTRLASEIPKRLLASRLHDAIESLPQLDAKGLTDASLLASAMRALSFLAHAWVWGGCEPRDSIPAQIAVPWCAIAEQLGRPPVLSYASYALDNWARIDPDGPIAIENLVLLQNFLGGADEDWFVAIHIDIEAKAAPIVATVPSILAAADQRDSSKLEEGLDQIAMALRDIASTLLRTPEFCDPYIYFKRVRPFIHGWKDHPHLPKGMIYRGVERFPEEQPQQFRGETGAQSGIVPLVDALLGVEHAEDPLRVYLRELRGYMPPKHRALLNRVELESSIRPAILEMSGNRAPLREIYDECLHWLENFRSTHLEFASRYIQSQAESSGANPTAVGTGGTPFMVYLAKHRDETSRHRLDHG